MPMNIDETTVFVLDLELPCKGHLWTVEAYTLLRIRQKNIYVKLCNAPQPHEVWEGARDWLGWWVQNLFYQAKKLYRIEALHHTFCCVFDTVHTVV